MSTRHTGALRSLDDWLAEQLAGHPTEIELGLERVAAVADRLDLRSIRARTLVVGGTNGKGSCVTLVGGLIGPRARVGSYTSPHLWHYNERIRIDGRPATDAEIVSAFEAIAAVRGVTPLTFFEWGTLAALWLFARAEVDVALLEVGLGGRLDAVNIVDADVSLVTSIDLDHTDWLGETREAIGHEKAGIYRAAGTALCADRRPPDSLIDHARHIGTRLRCIGPDFDIDSCPDGWDLRDAAWRLKIAACRDVFGDNLIAAVAATRALGYTVAEADIARAIDRQQALTGRRQVIDGLIPIIYDVGHNEAAVRLLVDALRDWPAAGRTHLVIGMLADKPVEAVAARLAPWVDRWYPAGLDQLSARGLDGSRLAARLGISAAVHANPRAALAVARSVARSGDRIVVCGSFFTVAQARSPEDE